MNEKSHVGIFSLPVLVGALGYFVDIYDLLLFTLVGEKSLLDLGVTGDVINSYKLSILNYQMLGLMIGGWLSTMVTVNEQAAVFPFTSVAV